MISGVYQEMIRNPWFLLIRIVSTAKSCHDRSSLSSSELSTLIEKCIK